MSDLESKQQGIRFEPVIARPESQPEPQPKSRPQSGPRSRPQSGADHFVLLAGVILPAAVLAIELATRICAETFFDPVPSPWHALAVALVPAANLLLWLRLRQPSPSTDASALASAGARTDAADRWLVLAAGAAMAIAAFYALVFLPMLPIAVIALALGGVGLLPMAPLLSLVAAWRLTSHFRARLAPTRLGRPLGAGIAAGLVLLLALDVPAAATRLGIQWASSSSSVERERGLALLRSIGDHDLLLRLCYDTAGRPGGLVSTLIMWVGNDLLEPSRRQVVQSTAEMREIYYRVTGTPFNARPAPFKAARLGDVTFDADHGGTTVGGRIKGLDITASRLDVSVAGNDAVAYIEWILEFRNTAPTDREVRLQIALPPGGVVSRATLWIGGEEKEGAYAGRDDVRAAYEKVAVVQRRDPLLVTTKGADRVLVQAFPVPGGGGTIKFKIGITAPLELIEPGKGRLVLPAVFERNFSFPEDVGHSVWIESKQPLTASTKGLAATRIDGGLYRLAGVLGDAGTSGTRPAITVERTPDAGPVVARLGEGEVVMQEVVSEPPRPATLMLVVDGSARMAKAAQELAAALAALPPAVRVGLVVAGEPLKRIEIAPATDAHKAAMVRLLDAFDYVGGQDNGPALAAALVALEEETGARLLWVHAPQPVPFKRSAAQIEQATERLKRLPEIILYTVAPGPNEMLPDRPWGWSARLLPRTTSTEADLAAFFTVGLGQSPRLVLRRTALTPDDKAGDGLPKGSDHITRLWAKDRIDDLLGEKGGISLADAVALAVKHRLVTPVSGVVVLETRKQYDDSKLTPVDRATVPTIPEPHEWALILVACMAVGWLAWRYRRQRVEPRPVTA